MKFRAAFLSLLFGAGLIAYGQSEPKADNTKVNQRDREPGAATADKQKMNKADRELTQNIRRAIIADKSLSTYAHNIKVISQNGVVTLKGPVHSEEEKKSIESKAAEVAGASAKIDNQIDVKP